MMKSDTNELFINKKLPTQIFFNGKEVNSVEFGEDVRWRIRVVAADAEYSMEDFFEDYGEMTEPPCEVKANNHLLAPIGMFKDCSALLKAPVFEAPNIENMHRMFYGCESLSEQPPYDTTKVYDFTDFVNGCQSLPKKFILDIRSVSNADRMICSFEDCSVAQLFLLNAQPQVKADIDISLLTGVGGDDDDEDEDEEELDEEDIKRREFSLNMKIIFGKTYKRITQDKYKMKELYPDEYATMKEVIDAIDIEGMTSINSMYEDCSSLIELPWMDTSKVTNMDAAFKNCGQITELPDFDFSASTSMSSTFYGCAMLKNESLSDFTGTTNVVDMSYMFYGCKGLTYIPTIAITNVRNMSYMFAYTGITSVDEFDFSLATNLSGLFEGCASLKSVENFSPSKATNISRLFYGCSSLEYLPIIDISSVVSIDGLRDMLTGTKVREIRFTNASATIKASITPALLGKADVTVLFGVKKLVNGEDFGMDTVYGAAYETMTHIPDALDTSQLESSYSMFGDMGELIEIPMIDVSGCNDCNSLFENCSSLRYVPPLDTGSAEELTNMFYGCSSLTYVHPIDIGSVTNASNLANMFYGTQVTSVTFWNPSESVRQAITPALLGKPDIQINYVWSHNTDMPIKVLTNDTCYMQDLYPETYMDMTATSHIFDTTQVTDMSGMYQNCGKLERADFHYTAKVKTASGMFENCINLVDVPEYDTSSLLDASAMFSQCTSLGDAPNLNMANVRDFSDMFYNCWSLVNVPEYDTRSATCMIDMFFGCSELAIVPVLDIRSIKKAEDLRDMFFDTKVTTVTFANASASVKSALTAKLLGKTGITINHITKA